MSKKFKDLSDEEIIKIFGKAYFDYLKKTDDSDFVVNQPQWDLLMDIVEYFQELAEKSGGFIEPVDLQPKITSGGVTLHIELLSMRGKEVTDFCAMLSRVHSFTLDATLDGNAVLSVCVPNVFVKK